MEEIFKNTLNTISDGIIITDDSYKIIYINDKSKNDIISVCDNNAIGLYITTLFNEFSILEKNKIYRNKKVNIPIKKKIDGNMLYASVSDIDNDCIYNIVNHY